MKKTILFIAIATPIAGICMAQPETAKKPSSEVNAENVAASLQKEMKDYDTIYTEFMKKVRAEKDRKKAVALYQKMPKATEYVNRILNTAEKHPQNATAKKSLLWCLRRVRTLENRDRLAKMFMTHYINDELIDSYSQSLARSYDPKAVENLRKIASTTSRENSVIYAQNYLAQKLKNDARRAPKLTDEQRKSMQAEALSIYKKLNSNPKVAQLNEKMAKRIASVIFEEENLAVGCKAPEIEGDDHTGTQFKLSDYRGKVVLLDFWGNW